MAQWGAKRYFERGKSTYIAVVAHVATETTFSETKSADLVDKLVLLDINGSRSVAEAMITALIAKYVGKPYAEWVAGIDHWADA